MEDKDWFWQVDSYKLDAESPLAISRSLWDGLAQSEADSRSLFASTPTGDILDSDHLVSTLNRLDVDASKSVHGLDAQLEGSPPSKRRRMLLFPESTVEPSGPDPPFHSGLESAYGSHCSATIPDCEDYGKYEVAVPASPNSLWYLKNDDPQFSLDEVLEPTSPKWMTRSFGDCQGHEAYDPTKLVVPDYEISGSCSDYQQQQSSESNSMDCPSTPFARSPTPTGRRPSAEFARMKSSTPAAYPFALLKPCGSQGDVTLSDINQRIAMPSSRPTPQLGGDDSRPSPSQSIVSPGGSPGLSGKSVVALTKIHTEGNGTITIMRTRG